MNESIWFYEYNAFEWNFEWNLYELTQNDDKDCKESTILRRFSLFNIARESHWQFLRLQTGTEKHITYHNLSTSRFDFFVIAFNICLNYAINFTALYCDKAALSILYLNIYEQFVADIHKFSIAVI